jgi:hypothetical protein
MRNELGHFQQINEREAGSDSFLPPRPVRRVVDRERCQTLLQTVLDGKEEPLGTFQVAQRLGYDEHSLMEHFPQECTEITRRAKAYRKQRKEQRFALIAEQVRQVTFVVHASGNYPSQHAITPLLPRGTMRMPVARTARQAACQELGLES